MPQTETVPYRRRFSTLAGIDLKGEPDLGGWYTDEEFGAVERVLRSSADWRTHFTGEERSRFEAEFATYVGARYAVATNSGGTAMDMAIACLPAEPGGEVVSCATNFVGTHLAVIRAGLHLILCEPEKETLNLDPNVLESKLTPKTCAVLVTHMNGHPANISLIEEVLADHCARHRRRPTVICDAARACGASAPDGKVGQTGALTVFSFQRKKLMTTLGEGGMVTTDSDAVAAKLRRLQSFGGGEEWGSNFKLTEVQAAFGRVQLRRLDEMNDARIAQAMQRTHDFQGLPGVQLPVQRAGYRDVYYLYTMLVHAEAPIGCRDSIVKRLARTHAIGCAIANPPTYWDNSLLYRHTRQQGPFPLAESIGERVFCPPLHPRMTQDENRRVVEAVREAVAHVDLA